MTKEKNKLQIFITGQLEKMKTLKTLLDNGLITQEESNAKRTAIINSI